MQVKPPYQRQMKATTRDFLRQRVTQPSAVSWDQKITPGLAVRPPSRHITLLSNHQVTWETIVTVWRWCQVTSSFKIKLDQPRKCSLRHREFSQRSTGWKLLACSIIDKQIRKFKFNAQKFSFKILRPRQPIWWLESPICWSQVYPQEASRKKTLKSRPLSKSRLDCATTG